MRKTYELPGIPISWKSHQGFGKRSFNPRYKEKRRSQHQLKLQHNTPSPVPLFNSKVRVDFQFEVPIPKSLPKSLQQAIRNGKKVYCSKRPDTTNYIKHIEDAMVNTVLVDDNIVCKISAEKYYSFFPKVIIHVEELED
jgi:Holliday junction resolvase RusA-like endonuclease